MTKKIFRIVILSVATAFLVSGCAVYNGSSTDIPLFREQGELQVEIGMPLYAATASYSLTDHIGLSANGDWVRRQWQAMAGFYSPVGSKFVWEVFGGFVMGKGSHSIVDDYWVKGRYGMPFLQADFGWRDLTRILHLDAAFSMRAGGLYGKMDRNWYEMIDGATYRIHQSYSSIRPVFEPSIELRFGWEHFKFNLRIYTIHVLNNEYKGRPAIPSDGGGYNFGISYRFDTRRKTAR